ncbi:MAG: ammonia-forming cytochrome c nitrite reductase subunit c552 [Bacillota bacterium]|nr:ammonia-forming cytochrome c nitrite reductase subunit c552 [Bacillota bacterium]
MRAGRGIDSPVRPEGFGPAQRSWWEKTDAIANARQSPGVDAELIRRPQDLHREAQWYWDWCSVENSTGFRNPRKITATLGKAIDLAHQARAAALTAVAAQAR